MAGNPRSGRRPKPTALKAKQGNPGRRPLNDQEPQFALVAADAVPDRLDADAKAVWMEYAPMLWAQGVLTVADALKFEQLCVAAGRLRQIGRHYAESQGPIVTSVVLSMDQSGGGAQHVSAKPNPLLGLELRYMQAVDKFTASFGMDPAMRSRVKAGTSPTQKHWLDELTTDGSAESAADRQLH